MTSPLAPRGLLAALTLALAAGSAAQPSGTPRAADPAATLPGPPAAAAQPGASAAPQPAVSGDAQRIYARAKDYLLQVRTLTVAGRSQAGVGSGFVVTDDGLVLTNYHVVAKLAMEPDRYVGETLDTRGERSAVEILGLDVLNDLAVLRVKRSRPGHLTLEPAPDALAQGQRLYSIGNPLDLGFAISEGRFNGVLTRPYYEQILFSGAINPGMSGGPALDDEGRVVGVNVAKRLDGELISFLVPARAADALLKRAMATPTPPPARRANGYRDEVARQLAAHQAMMARRLLAKPFATRPLGPYRAPVHEMPGVRCWGTSSPADKPYQVDRLECRMESALYVDEGLQVGYVNIRHEHIFARRLNALRFSRLYSAAFRNEYFGSHRDKRLTGPECTEAFTRGPAKGAPPLRAVLCVRALRKFDALYDFSLLTATVDDAYGGVQSRIDVSGVSYDNGLAITRAFLEAIGKGQA